MFITWVSTGSVRPRSGTASVIGPRPMICRSAGTGLLAQGMTVPRLRIGDQAEALAFEILEIEREVAGALLDVAGGRHPCSVEVVLPPVEIVLAVDAQAGAATVWLPRCSRAACEIEEGEVGAGRGDAVTVEQVIGGGVVLVDRLLDQPHAQRLGVEFDVLLRLRR